VLVHHGGSESTRFSRLADAGNAQVLSVPVRRISVVSQLIAPKVGSISEFNAIVLDPQVGGSVWLHHRSLAGRSGPFDMRGEKTAHVAIAEDTAVRRQGVTSRRPVSAAGVAVNGLRQAEDVFRTKGSMPGLIRSNRVFELKPLPRGSSLPPRRREAHERPSCSMSTSRMIPSSRSSSTTFHQELPSITVVRQWHIYTFHTYPPLCQEGKTRILFLSFSPAPALQMGTWFLP